jgi:UDP-glucose 4-epimerase
MQNKEISLVTGGAGFIGSHLVDFLISKNHEVRVLDDLSGGHEKNISHHYKNINFKFENKNICNLKNNEKIFKDVNYIFHLAGRGDIVPSIKSPLEYFQINNTGTIKVLENSRRSTVKKFVYAASSSCYGLAKTPTREDFPIMPMYPYALSKYLGELLVFHWSKVYKLPVNSIRIFNAYGTRVKTTGVYGAVFGVFLKQKISKKPFTIVGNGEQKRDFLYVSDVAAAFYLAAKSRVVNQIFNLGAGNPQKINYLVKLLGGGKKVYLPKRPGEPECTYANINKIKKLLSWKPKVSFEQGVAKMLENIDYWEDAPLWDTKKINKATKDWFRFLG